MKHVVIIGAGGHGREVAEVLAHQARFSAGVEILGFVDDNPGLQGGVVDRLPILGSWSWFHDVDRSQLSVICAVGQPATCRRLVARATQLGLDFFTTVSPLAHISPRSSIGRGVVIFPGVIVNSGAVVHDYAILNVGTTVSHDSRIGRYCNLNPGTHIAGEVTIGEGCYVGMGTNVIQRTTIGDWTVIGAGAAVVRNLPANVTAVGVPAKIIKTRKEGWHER